MKSKLINKCITELKSYRSVCRGFENERIRDNWFNPAYLNRVPSTKDYDELTEIIEELEWELNK